MNELAMFAKYWEAGRVKTRLGEQIGLESSSRIYRQFIVTLLERLRNEADRRVLVYAPPKHRDAFDSLVCHRPWELAPQIAGGLGERMDAFFRQRLNADVTALVLIGSDSPTLPTKLIQTAFAELRTNDLVLGPTADGGYYLIGMRSPLPQLFREIEWSTPKVWQQTMERVESSRELISLAVLPEWYDVDTLEELRRLADELQRARQSTAASRALEQLCRETVAGRNR